MRTPVTLDPDVEAVIKRAMRERGLTFEQAVNDAIRAGMRPPEDRRGPRFSTYDMGEAVVEISKALRLAGEREDEELAARLARGA